MTRAALFTDASVNPQQRLGVGVCLLLSLPLPEDCDRNELAGRLHYRYFTGTSSTVLELQTVLWGLELYRGQQSAPHREALQVYTDSQCVAGLSARRARLEGAAYRSARSGGVLANAALYQDFYAASDQLGFEVVKVTGHSPAATHDRVQQIFALVDRRARQELQRWLAVEDSRR